MLRPCKKFHHPKHLCGAYQKPGTILGALCKLTILKLIGIPILTYPKPNSRFFQQNLLLVSSSFQLIATPSFWVLRSNGLELFTPSFISKADDQVTSYVTVSFYIILHKIQVLKLACSFPPMICPPNHPR